LRGQPAMSTILLGVRQGRFGPRVLSGRERRPASGARVPALTPAKQKAAGGEGCPVLVKQAADRFTGATGGSSSRARVPASPVPRRAVPILAPDVPWRTGTPRPAWGTARPPAAGTARTPLHQPWP